MPRQRYVPPTYHPVQESQKRVRKPRVVYSTIFNGRVKHGPEYFRDRLNAPVEIEEPGKGRPESFQNIVRMAKESWAR